LVDEQKGKLVSAENEGQLRWQLEKNKEQGKLILEKAQAIGQACRIW